jgi:decaprenylphospho-beta-D-erythro-pentofuranosid-2-ulose 2-reductase
VSKVLIIGATSTIANEVSKLYLTRGDHLHLYAKDPEKLRLFQQDLAIRFPNQKIESFAFDPKNLSPVLAQISQEDFDIVLIAIGQLLDTNQIAGLAEKVREVIDSNVTIPVLFLEQVVKTWESSIARKEATKKLAIIGSVAGDRGRAKNYLYGASKGFLADCVSGLNQKLAKTNIRVILIKPGPVNTAMTRNLTAAGAKLATPEKVAKDIVKAIDKGKPVTYTPRIWQAIMLIISSLPNFIFNKLSL